MRRLSRIQEKRLTEDWQFIRNNAGRLLISEFRPMFSHVYRERAWNGNRVGKNNSAGNHEWLSVVWQIARPVVLRWVMGMGWQVVRNMLRKKRGED